MAYDILKQHAPNDETKTVTLRKCWSLIFDVNGNAPGDRTIASFATEELADLALKLWGGMKDDDQNFSIVIDGKLYSSPPAPFVDGWSFDTFYTVEEDWQEDDQILTSLAQLIKIFDCEEDTKLPNGVYFSKGDEDDEDGDGEWS